MKSLEHIINQTPIFMHLFTDEESVFSNYQVSDEQKEGVKILFASYGEDNYGSCGNVLDISVF